MHTGLRDVFSRTPLCSYLSHVWGSSSSTNSSQHQYTHRTSSGLNTSSWNRHSEGRVRGTRNQQIEAYSFPDYFFFFLLLFFFSYSRDALVSIGDQESNIDTLFFHSSSLDHFFVVGTTLAHKMLTNTPTKMLNYTLLLLLPLTPFSNTPS